MSLQENDNNHFYPPIPLQEQLMEVDTKSISSKGTQSYSQRPQESAMPHKRQVRLVKKESGTKLSRDQIQFRSHQGSIDSQAKTHIKNLPSDADLMKLKTIDIVEKESVNEENNCFHSSGPESEEDDDDKMSYRQINLEIPLQNRVNTQMECFTGSQNSIQESDPQQIIAKFENKQKELKNFEKRSKELERFQVHMGLQSSYEKVNPLLSLYKSMNPKIQDQSAQKLQMKYPQVFIQKPFQNDYQQFNLNNPLCINGINTMSPPKDQSKKRQQQRKVELTAERNQNKICSYLKDGYKQAKASESKRNKSSQKTPSVSRKTHSQLDQSLNNGNAMHQESIEQQLVGQNKKIKVYKVKQKKLVINVSMCRYPIVRKIAKYEFGHFLSNRDMFAPVNGQIILDGTATQGTSYVTNGLARDPEDDYFDIYWMDGAGQRHLDRFIQLKNYQRINHFPGMNLLCRKNELGKLLNEMQTKWPGEFDFFPKTWVLPRDQRAFEAYVNECKLKLEENKIMKYQAANSGEDSLPIFIVKPEAQCQGKGIFLVHDYKDIEAYNQSSYQQVQSQNQEDYNRIGQVQQNWDKFHCVVQEYVKKPMLIDRMKFDLRLYVLVLGIDPMRIFLFKDGLARLATTAYCEPTDYNMNNMQMHLTNYAINKNSLGFMKNYTAVADFVGSKRSLKFVMRYVRKQFNADTTKLMAQIKDLTIKTILSAQPHISQTYKNYQIDDYENSLAFEILGFDIMLDQNCKPILLEINHAPSFATDSPIDEKIKGQVIYDAINMLGLSQKRKKNYKAINKLRVDLRRMQSKKTTITQAQRDQFRKEHDELRNQYEFRNKGMFEMIYPILDEITLDPWEEKMAPYQNMLDHTQYDYLKKHNLKIPPQLEKMIKADQKKKAQKNVQKNLRPNSQSKVNEKESKQILSKKAQQINKIKEYYANVKPKVFTNYDHQSRKLIQKQVPGTLAQTQQPPEESKMNNDLNLTDKEEQQQIDQQTQKNNVIVGHLEFSDDENPPNLNDDQMLADLRRQHNEQQRRSMMSSYNNTQDDGLIFVKSFGGLTTQSRQVINSSANSQGRQNQIPQSSLSISKSVINNNGQEQKGKKIGSRTIFKQNQHVVKGSERLKQPLQISSMGVQTSNNIEGQASTEQPSIDQLNRERVTGMINKAHDLQSKMQQLNILNSRGPKPPIQGKIMRPQSSIQPNRRIKIQVNDQPIHSQGNNNDIAGISIQYKDDYNIQGVVRETEKSTQKRKCQELQEQITSIFYNQNYSVLPQKPQDQIQSEQIFQQQIASVVDSKETLSLGDDELRKQINTPDDPEFVQNSEQTAGTASAQGGVSRATKRAIYVQADDPQENYFKQCNIQLTSADLDFRSNDHDRYQLLSYDANQRTDSHFRLSQPPKQIDLSQQRMQEHSNLMPIIDQSPKQTQERAKTSFKLGELRNKQNMRSFNFEQESEQAYQSLTPDITGNTRIMQSSYNALNQANYQNSAPFGKLRKSIPNNFLQGQDSVQIMGITAERGGAQRTVEFKTGQIGQIPQSVPQSVNLRRRIVPNNQSSLFSQPIQSQESSQQNTLLPPQKMQQKPKIPRSIVSAKSRVGNSSVQGHSQPPQPKKQKRQTQVALINGRQVVISEPQHSKSNKIPSNWSSSANKGMTSEAGKQQIDRNKF